MIRLLVLALALTSCIADMPDGPTPCLPDAGTDSPDPTPAPEPTATSPQQSP